jgi:hypothetical protein
MTVTMTGPGRLRLPRAPTSIASLWSRAGPLGSNWSPGWATGWAGAAVPRANQGETAATIRMRMRRS